MAKLLGCFVYTPMTALFWSLLFIYINFLFIVSFYLDKVYNMHDLIFYVNILQGCDGSVLLDKSNERSEIPNLTMRKEAFKIVNDLRERVHKQCGRVVSCADILTIAARDSVFLVNRW